MLLSSSVVDRVCILNSKKYFAKLFELYDNLAHIAEADSDLDLIFDVVDGVATGHRPPKKLNRKKYFSKRKRDIRYLHLFLTH